jgi:phage terminase large subunit-like protein
MVAQAVATTAPIRLFPRQMRFVRDPARFPAYCGGIGAGKSFAGAAKVLARVGRKETGGVYAPTYPMLRDATKRTLLSLLDAAGVAYLHHVSENVILIPASGHEIICRSLDNPDSLRGPNLDYAWVDEASLAARESWSVVKGRVRTGDHPQAWATFTPKGRNWCWEEWERDAGPDHPLYRVRTDENPELPPGFAASLGYAGRFAEQELGGAFVAFEGVVYPAFDRNVHVRRADCDGWRTLVAVDVGTRNPTAILTVRHSGDRIHVAREVYRRQMDSEEIPAAIAAIAAEATPELVVIDPSASGVIKAVRKRRLPVVGARNEIAEGIRQVTAALADLTVDPSCVNLIAEFERYAYPASRQQRDVPVPENDHALDALRYAVMEISSPRPKARIW